MRHEEGFLVAVVDFDNVVPGVRDPLDIENGLETICDTLRDAVKRNLSTATDVTVRLYGGWLRKNGLETRNATWLAAKIGDFRGTKDGVFLDPMIAYTSMWTTRRVNGTFRFPSDRDADDPDKPHQKMVDSMIIVDITHLAVRNIPAIAMSDDDDLVPGIMTYGDVAPEEKMVWLRRRPHGHSCNDDSLNRQGVIIETYTSGL